jgi:hypothetical protein
MCPLCDGFGTIDIPNRPGFVQMCPECETESPWYLRMNMAAMLAGPDGWTEDEDMTELQEERLRKQREGDEAARKAGILAGMSDLCPKWLIVEFENGHTATDEPPGFEDRAYKLWREAGGQVKPPKPVTADDL